MITLVFFRTGDRPIHKAGPVSWVQFDGGSLRVGLEGEPLSQYRGGIWRVAGCDAPKFTLCGSATLVLEGKRPRDPTVLGEYDELEVVDGAIYDHATNSLLARLEESSGTWFFYHDKSCHASLRVAESQPAASQHNVDARSANSTHAH